MRNKNISTSYNKLIVCHRIFILLLYAFSFLCNYLIFTDGTVPYFWTAKYKFTFRRLPCWYSSSVKCKAMLSCLTNSIILTLNICKYLSYLKVLELYKMRNGNRHFNTVTCMSFSFLCKLYQSSSCEPKLLYKKPKLLYKVTLKNVSF